MCELYTDVAGVYSADPRIVSKARRMAEISFDELLEMTATGCPKPAMRSVEFARRHQVKLHIRSAFSWEPGTIVTEETPDMEQRSEEHTSELQSLMRISYAVFCLKKK